MEVSTADLAEILNVTERRVQQLANAGVLRRLAHGTWVLPESVQSYVAHRVKGASGKQKAKSGSTDERIKLVKLQREELKLAAEERELIPIGDALEAMAKVCGTVVFNLNTVAPGLTRDVEMRDRLQAAVDDALTKAAELVAELGRKLRAGGEDPDPDEEDDA